MKHKFFFVLAAAALLASCGGPTGSSNPIQSEEPETSSSEVVEAITITVDKTEVSVEVGKTAIVAATVTGAMNKNVTWTSSDPTVATVSGGTITGVKAGSATITAKSVADETKTATVKVTVTEPVVEITKISQVLEMGSKLSTDGKAYSEEFTTRGVYTGMNNAVSPYQGKNQHVARYIQDGDSALLLFKTYDEDWADVKIGDVVEVTTAVCNYYGLVETGVGKTKSVKKVTDPSIVASAPIVVSATSNPTLTSADVSRRAHLEKVEVTDVSTSSSGNMAIKFSAGEDKKEETLYLKSSQNDLGQMADVKAKSLITLDTWVGVIYGGEG
ncbi:MAG: Ig-like domain-containing protein, partial [Candidatus Enteromonas sp.]|nr:Ig-like domain-containing protein [Candidatus Enteromonas sp.]